MIHLKHKKRWLGLGLLVLLLGMLIAIVSILNAPSHGKIVSVDEKTKIVKTVAPKLAPASSLSNSYFNLSLPVGYSLTGQSTTTSGLLWNGTIIRAGSLGSQVITIAVQNGSLDSDSSYNLRRQSSAYQAQTLTAGSQVLPVFTRVDNTSGEATAFWQHAGYLATISVVEYSATDSSNCLQTLTAVLSNWQWQG